MNESTIGIKIADGSYFPVLEENSTRKKRLVLTTVNDNQESVQIDLYRGKGDTIDEAVYIGSLQIEHIEKADKGNPEIELLLGLDEEGNLDAKASDNVTGESQSLSLSLETLDEEQMYDEPDFEIDQSSDTSDLLTPEEESQLTSGEYEQTIAQETVPERRRRNPLLLVLFIVVCLGLLGTAAYLIFTHFSKSSTTEMTDDTDGSAADGSDTAMQASDDGGGDAMQAEASDAETQGSAADTMTADAENAQDSEAEAARTADSGSGAADIAPEGGVWYKIRWGDTLWDLADSFYDNPWDYPSIANQNKIPNPDKIYTGKQLYIPEKKKK